MSVFSVVNAGESEQRRPFFSRLSKSATIALCDSGVWPEDSVPAATMTRLAILASSKFFKLRSTGQRVKRKSIYLAAKTSSIQTLRW